MMSEEEPMKIYVDFEHIEWDEYREMVSVLPTPKHMMHIEEYAEGSRTEIIMDLLAESSGEPIDAGYVERTVAHYTKEDNARITVDGEIILRPSWDIGAEIAPWRI